jgi:hypothetical protein
MTPNSHFHHALPAHLDRVFTPLCEALAPAAIPALKQAVAAHVEETRAAQARTPSLDVAQAERIAAILAKLLDEYAGGPEPHRPLIVGAARYFVSTADAEADTLSLTGFDDDMEVLNHVLLSIGRPELCQELL